MLQLIIDIDNVLGAYGVERGKSGVYVVADNVIRRLAEKPGLHISFSCSEKFSANVPELQKDPFYGKFTIIDYREPNRFDRLLNSIEKMLPPPLELFAAVVQ